MQVIKRTLGVLRRLSRKQLFVAGAFTLALAGAVSLGIATKQQISAASVVRECEHNSIDYKNYNGGCGAANPAEYIADLKTNDPADLQVSAQNFNSGFHLSPSEYSTFASTAQEGVAYKDGTVKVNGQTVLTNAWSIGRDQFSYASKYSIPGDGTSYWSSKSQDVFAVNAIPVMVMFDNTGAVQFIAMNPCGNLMGGTKVAPKYGCTMLNKTAVSGKQNTYSFTTNAFATNNAAITKLVYNFGDGTTQTVTSATQAVTHTYTKAGTWTASVQVYVSLPGNHSAVTPIGGCQTQITVVAPYYACSALLATALDDKNQQFRFTVKANYGNGATLTSADFTLDGKSTTTGVTTKDTSGNIYKDYSFTDAADHTVVAKVNFNIAGSVASATCQAKVTSTKTPTCTVPGKENLPPNSPQCYEECKPNIPVGSPECTPTPPTTPPASELPNTGAGNVIGIFGGTTALGAAGHRLFLSRRRRHNS